jgi:hypothetical protein
MSWLSTLRVVFVRVGMSDRVKNQEDAAHQEKTFHAERWNEGKS